MKERFLKYKHSAKVRGHTFSLSIETFERIASKRCYLCNSPPANKAYSRNREQLFVYNGIDRVDNKIGYVKGNVKPCCARCNYMKSRLSLRAFKNHLAQIIKHLL